MRKFFIRHVSHPLFMKREGIPYRRHRPEIQKEFETATGAEAYAFPRIKAMLAYAYAHSSYYRSYYDRHGFRPDDFQSMGDLKKIPILEKRLIAENLNQILVPTIPEKNLVPTATGGTTGNSFKFYYDRECWAKRYCLTSIVNAQIGWHVGDPVAIAWSADQDISSVRGYKAKIRAALVDRTYMLNAHRINPEKLRAWISALQTQGIEILYGYAHSIAEIAKYVIDRKVTGLKIRRVVTTAEPLYPKEREIVRQAFNCRIVDRYASREHGPMAQECLHGNLHYFSNSIYVENDGGDLLITDYWNKAIPFIRYRIGDTGHAATGACACGSGLPVMGTFAGRETDFLIAQDGSLVSGMALHDIYYNAADHSFGRSQLLSIQFIQDRLNHIQVNVVPGLGFHRQGDERPIIDTIHSLFGKQMQVTFKYLDQIPKTSSGKYRFAINALPR